MLKQLLKVTPYMLGSWIVWGLISSAEALILVSLTELLDQILRGDSSQFTTQATQVLLLVIVCVPLAILHSYTYGYYKKQANKRMKGYYLQKVFAKNISEFHKENNSKYLSGMTNDLNSVETQLIDTIYEVGKQSIVFITGVVMVASASPVAILVILLIIALNTYSSSRAARPISKETRERSELFESYTAYIKEVISAFHIIKSNNLQERIRTNFEEKSGQVQQKGYHIDKMLSFVQAKQNASTVASMYIMLLACAYGTITGSMSVGGALLIIQGAQRVMWPVMILAEKAPQLFVVRDLIKKIEETLTSHETYEEVLGFEGLKDKIVLHQTSFGYEEGLILDQVNLELEKGGKYLIVGPSGGGKSTLLKLLRKYFNPTGGEILVDGKPLRAIKKEDFYAQIANVEQQVFIFEDTLRNNITLYKAYSEQEIEEVLQKAGLTEFVAQLPDGLETMIYDNGSNVSGGERSRIVIARGLLTKASIIFLDEAFAALDLQRAKEIEEMILNLEDVTVINVSHVIFKENQERYTKVFSVKHQQVECVI